MRLFTAVRFPPAVLEELRRAQEDLRRQGASGNFTRLENLHLTLVFLGETPEADAARDALEEAGSSGTFELAISGSGRFGDLWWAGVEPNPDLCALAGTLQAALRRRGFSIERRKFQPHITLARQLTAPRAPVLHLSRTAMEVTRISLMRSERAGGKLIYTELYGKDLKRPLRGRNQ